MLATAAAVWTAEGEMLAVAGWWREDHYVRVLPGEAEGKGGINSILSCSTWCNSMKIERTVNVSDSLRTDAIYSA